MSAEAEEAVMLEQARFRAMIVAMHPEKAKEILDILDGTQESGEFAPELTDEEMADYTPVSVQEVEHTIDLMRRFGIAVQDD